MYLTVDHSTEAVLDNASAQAIWKESLSDKLTKLAKLYPTTTAAVLGLACDLLRPQPASREVAGLCP